jgi:N utilization substance protein B
MARGRHGARRLLLQALYQRQLNGNSAAELVAQFSDSKEFRGIDAGYFRTLIEAVIAGEASLNELIAQAADRPVGQLDPVERGILWIGLTELRAQPDVPPKVIIDEAVQLAREFGATDSYRYVNAVLDYMAPKLRPAGAGRNAG